MATGCRSSYLFASTNDANKKQTIIRIIFNVRRLLLYFAAADSAECLWKLVLPLMKSIQIVHVN